MKSKALLYVVLGVVGTIIFSLFSGLVQNIVVLGAYLAMLVAAIIFVVRLWENVALRPYLVVALVLGLAIITWLSSQVAVGIVEVGQAENIAQNKAETFLNDYAAQDFAGAADLICPNTRLMLAKGYEYNGEAWSSIAPAQKSTFGLTYLKGLWKEETVLQLTAFTERKVVVGAGHDYTFTFTDGRSLSGASLNPASVHVAYLGDLIDPFALSEAPNLCIDGAKTDGFEFSGSIEPNE